MPFSNLRTGLDNEMLPRHREVGATSPVRRLKKGVNGHGLTPEWTRNKTANVNQAARNDRTPRSAGRPSATGTTVWTGITTGTAPRAPKTPKTRSTVTSRPRSSSSTAAGSARGGSRSARSASGGKSPSKSPAKSPAKSRRRPSFQTKSPSKGRSKAAQLRPWQGTAQHKETKGLSTRAVDVGRSLGVNDCKVLMRLERHLTHRKERMIDFFRDLDNDKSGGVSWNELRAGLADRGITYSKDEEQQLMVILDPNGDGEIEYHEMAAARRELASNAGKKYASTSISPTKTKKTSDPLSAPSRITEGMLTLTLLEKKMMRENPEFKQSDIPSARPQLPIGRGPETVAVLAARNVKKVPMWARPKEGQEEEKVAEKDAIRLHKRSQAIAVVDWDNRKAEQERAQRTALRKQQQEQSDVISQFTQGREARAQRKFQEWCDKKEVAKKNKSHTAKLSVFTGVVRSDEFIAAIRRFPSSSNLMLELYEKLLPSLDDKERVQPGKFYQVLDQVDIELRVQAQLDTVRGQRAAEDAVANKDLTPEQRTNRNKAALLQRHATAIIDKWAMTRAGGVKLFATISAALNAYEEAEYGQIKDSDFMNCLKELPLGISSGARLDVAKVCSTKGSDLVRKDALEAYIIHGMAKHRLDNAAPAATTQFRTMMALCDIDGPHEARMTFEDIHVDALQYRDEVNFGTTGWIKIKELMSALAKSHTDDRLPLSKRKDIQKAVETYCKLIDRHRDGVVERSRVDLFLRKIELELTAKAEARAMPYDQRRRRDIRHRMFRTMIHSFERDGTKFAVLQTRFADGLEAATAGASLAGDEHPMLAKSTLIATMRRMEMGLSSVQIEELAKACNLDGRGVYTDDMVGWLLESYERDLADRRRKADPRSALCDDIMRSLGAAAQTVLPDILANYTSVLLGWDGEAPEVESPLVASYSNVRGASDGAVAADRGENDFDVSWGKDKHGVGIMMPPGALRQRADLTVKVTPMSVSSSVYTDKGERGARRKSSSARRRSTSSSVVSSSSSRM